MNKVIRKEMLAGDLPEDLRRDLPNDAKVTVTVETGEPGLDARALSALLNLASPPPAGPKLTVKELITRHPPRGTVTRDEAVRAVRDLRDEWDD